MNYLILCFYLPVWWKLKGLRKNVKEYDTFKEVEKRVREVKDSLKQMDCDKKRT